MFGTGLLKGLGVTFNTVSRTFRDDLSKVPSRYTDSIDLGDKQKIINQPASNTGLFTIQYPEERRQWPENFRFIPMLLWDTEKGEDRCTACGICAKVCPPQCIWIVRDSDENGKPVARPAEYFLDASVCMSCNYCVEFCPFDAIKMNHDVELAVFERYPQLVYNKAELTVPIEYYAALWPNRYAQEEEARRKAEEEEKAKAEAKAKRAAEKAKQDAEKPKRSPEEVAEMKRKAQERAAAAKAKAAGGDPAASAESAPATGGGEDAEAAAKKARMEELKRKAQERAKQRREGNE